MTLPAGVTWRPLNVTDVDGHWDGPDIDLAFTVAKLAESTTAADPDTTREEIRVLLTGPDSVPEQNRLVFDGDGHAIGLLSVECEPAAREVFADVYVVPEWAGTLNHELVSWGVAAARLLAGVESGWHVDAGCYADDAPYQKALRDNGFRIIRRFWRMEMDLDDVAPELPEPPAGVTRSVAVTDDDRRLVHGVRNRSFAEHFGSTERPYEEWIRFHIDSRAYAPDRWWIAWLDGEPVGICLEDDSRLEFGATYVRTLGVIPAARGRGIARWLLRCTAADAVRAGRRAVLLAVDSENTTGATALYESVGMRPTQVIDVHRLALPDPGSTPGRGGVCR